MPRTNVFFYQENDHDIPVLDWLRDIGRRDQRAVDACRAAIEQLRHYGYEPRRPRADLLRDGIYELRVRVGRVNYRILYFFHGRNIALLAHGMTKEKTVPSTDIERALKRKCRYEADPASHRHQRDD
ncbi:type II toxin-antitoxin system RelE/ParE family toxin [Mucisphaera calidilacus]|uniref:Type II toxin-antitoxin system RelE/ParE family toxin n=1 Tax=Mucisphaera calidilacus TaxID=2527982 RepID=A0A518BTT2_9BACT|nr:type II toxin-antitoxin system RelE/ParE family toxin [Mucisphaera calidilacus]QDU70392.1 hypothetical protein Pan265_02190 [Mucisphaera calidilacus]